MLSIEAYDLLNVLCVDGDLDTGHIVPFFASKLGGDSLEARRVAVRVLLELTSAGVVAWRVWGRTDGVQVLERGTEACRRLEALLWRNVIEPAEIPWWELVFEITPRGHAETESPEYKAYASRLVAEYGWATSVFED